MYRNSAQQPTVNYQADLGSDTQVVGNVYLRRNRALRYQLQVRYLRNIRSVRLRLGSSGGPVVSYLYGPTFGGGSRIVNASGTISDCDLRGPLKGRSVSILVNEMNRGNVWADVATIEQPYGAAVGRVYRKR